MPRHLRRVRLHQSEAPAVAQEILDLELLVRHHEDVGIEPRPIDRGEAGVVELLDVDAPDLGADLWSQATNLEHRSPPAGRIASWRRIPSPGRWEFLSSPEEIDGMARPVAYPDHIEPLVQFVEETAPEHIVARTHDKLAGGTPVKDMLLAVSAGGGALLGPAARPSRRPAPSAGRAARRPQHRRPAVRRLRAHAGDPERGRGQQAHPVAGHGPVHPGRRAAGVGAGQRRGHARVVPVRRRAAASTTPAITTSSTCCSSSRRCRCWNTCSRSRSRRTSSTTTTSCSRSSPGGRWSTSAGSTRSTSAGRRCATSRAPRCRPRWTTWTG